MYCMNLYYLVQNSNFEFGIFGWLLSCCLRGLLGWVRGIRVEKRGVGQTDGGLGFCCCSELLLWFVLLLVGCRFKTVAALVTDKGEGDWKMRQIRAVRVGLGRLLIGLFVFNVSLGWMDKGFLGRVDYVYLGLFEK